MLKLDSLDYISLAECIGVSLTTWRNRAAKLPSSTKWRKLHRHYAVQGHSRSSILIPIENPYTTSYSGLIKTYLRSCAVSKLWPIIGRFFAIDSWEWSPANIRINFTSSETRGIVLPEAENRTIISSFLWTQYQNVTDGQTDRRTESL